MPEEPHEPRGEGEPSGESSSPSSTVIRRVCFIASEGPPLTIRLTAENGLRSVGRFLLHPPGHGSEDIPPVRWTIETRDEGEGEHVLPVFPDILDGFSMSFRISTCTTSPGAATGRVAVLVAQNGEDRPVLPAATFEPERVPECPGSEASQIEGAFILLHQE